MKLFHETFADKIFEDAGISLYFKNKAEPGRGSLELADELRLLFGFNCFPRDDLQEVLKYSCLYEFSNPKVPAVLIVFLETAKYAPKIFCITIELNILR